MSSPTPDTPPPKKPRSRKPPVPKTPSALVVEDLKQTVEAAREAVEHAGAAVEHGRQAIPEVTDVARAALDQRFEQMKLVGHEAADVVVDRLDLARDLIVEQVRARPLASAFAAVGAGVLLGMLIRGNRR
jgi:ElaB/YqjD/DUF883 family membrane-anchored ribosome-binding protein